MAELQPYVKFMRGTPAAYAKLTSKDPDTLYFIAESDESDAQLYLGDRVIAGGDLPVDLSLANLSDVLIGEGLADASFLVYSETASKWVNASIEDLIFGGASELSDGQAGLVVAPKAGDQSKFLRGDGNWVTIETAEVPVPTVVSGTLEEGETKAEALVRLTDGLVAKAGDVVCISSSDAVRAVYVFDGTEWLSLTDNYASENVLLGNGKTLAEYVTALFAENSNIVQTESGAIALKNWGVQYYRFVEATEDTEAHYELQLVDETHPWKAGLEPRVVEENGALELGWYEPNSTTVDGLSAQITTLQSAVNGNSEAITLLNAALADVYTKTETDSAIATAVANSEHLKREIVADLSEMTEENVIYMLPTGLQMDDDKYDEYMVLNGVVEKLGSWEVDLTGYVQKQDGFRLMSDEEGTKLAGIAEGAEKNYISSVSSDFSVLDGLLSLDLTHNATVISLNDLIDTKVTAVEGKSLIEDSLIEKLMNIEAEAEKNFISSVTEDFTVENGELQLNLVNNEIFAALQSSVNTHTSEIAALNQSMATMTSTLEAHSTDIAALKDAMTWKDLTE